MCREEGPVVWWYMMYLCALIAHFLVKKIQMWLVVCVLLPLRCPRTLGIGAIIPEGTQEEVVHSQVKSPTLQRQSLPSAQSVLPTACTPMTTNAIAQLIWEETRKDAGSFPTGWGYWEDLFRGAFDGKMLIFFFLVISWIFNCYWVWYTWISKVIIIISFFNTLEKWLCISFWIRSSILILRKSTLLCFSPPASCFTTVRSPSPPLVHSLWGSWWELQHVGSCRSQHLHSDALCICARSVHKCCLWEHA